MKNLLLTGILILTTTWSGFAQDPMLSSWLINTTGIKARYYMKGNSTPITMSDEANVQKLQYSDDWIYVHTTGLPAYPTGPFLDGNPSTSTNQDAIFRISRNPQKNNGTPTETRLGNIGIFINGVALFDYRDGVSWKSSTQTYAGGPFGGKGDEVWNRDAVVAERTGFDCAKGHPAMGNYHHHQNPSAFNLDRQQVSNVCDLYAADGLYVIDSTKHSPLIGFTYDGYPIYGAYAYKNEDGTGGIVRMKSGYSLRAITVRTHYADGSDVTDGPDVNSTHPLGTFREDYEFIAGSSDDVLDEHNGRYCVTPEFPNGTYAYFCTVDENWNSAYPYCVGPTFYGVVNGNRVNSVNETVETYTPNGISRTTEESLNPVIYPNPAGDILAIQVASSQWENIQLELFDLQGKQVDESTILPGSTIGYFDTRTLYPGEYILRISIKGMLITRKVLITHP